MLWEPPKPPMRTIADADEPAMAPRAPLRPEEVLALIGQKIDKSTRQARGGGIVHRSDGVSPDLLWLAMLVGRIWASTRETRAEPKTQEVVAAFAELFADEFGASDTASATEESKAGAIWQVTLDRPVEPAITRSALAVKADAARLLFSISCRNLTWAVIDSGIDGGHPAFWDWTDHTPPPVGGAKPSRVTRTYDFTRVRDLLVPATTAGLFGADALPAEKIELRDRLVRNLQDLGEEASPNAAAQAGPAARRTNSIRAARSTGSSWSLSCASRIRRLRRPGTARMSPAFSRPTGVSCARPAATPKASRCAPTTT